MVALDKLFSFGRDFDIKTDPASTTKHYAEAFKNYPGDLVVEGVKRICGNWKWGNRLPMPGDIRAAVHDEFWERKKAESKLKLAIGKAA